MNKTIIPAIAVWVIAAEGSECNMEIAALVFSIVALLGSIAVAYIVFWR